MVVDLDCLKTDKSIANIDLDLRTFDWRFEIGGSRRNT